MIKYYTKHKQGNTFIIQVSCILVDTGIWQVPVDIKRFKIIFPKEFEGSIFHSNFLYDTEYDARVAAIAEIRFDLECVSSAENSRYLFERKVFKRIVSIKTIKLKGI